MPHDVSLSNGSPLFRSMSGQPVEATGDPGNQYFVVDQLSFGCFTTVFAIEPLDAACRVNELLLAREKRVAIRANLKANFRLRRASLPRLAARAMHGRVHILRMNIWLHYHAPIGNFPLTLTLKGNRLRAWLSRIDPGSKQARSEGAQS